MAFFFRLFLSSVYSFLFFSGFIAFIILKNYPAAVLAIFSGVANAMLSHLHYLYKKGSLPEWYSYNQLVSFGRFGFFNFAMGTTLLVYFIVIESMLAIPILPVSQSVVIPIIWSIILLKSGVMLLYYAGVYSQTTSEGLLTQEVTEAITDELPSDSQNNA